MKRYIVLGIITILSVVLNMMDTYANDFTKTNIIEKKSWFYEHSLYNSWDNERIRCYSEWEIPVEYRIELDGGTMPITHNLVTSHYGYRPKFKRFHYGVDVKAYTGDTVVSAFDGKVRIVKYEPHGYGNYVVIRHNNGLETIYGHLSKHLVKINQEVVSGDPIGLAGNTGRSTGSHLHFETLIVGRHINPEEMFHFETQTLEQFYMFHKYKQ